MACMVDAVTALIFSPTLHLRRSPAHCRQFQANCTTSLRWNVTYTTHGRRAIRGEYDGVDLALSSSSRTSNSRAKAVTSLVGGVNLIYAEDVDQIREPIPRAPPVSKPERDYTVREAKLDEELWAAAWIRAEGYCEDQPYVRSSGTLRKWHRAGPEPQEYRVANRRYVDSYKKNFAEQEFDALKRRLMGKYGQSIKCICFVSVMNQSAQDSSDLEKTTAMQSVVGTLDLSIRQLAQGEAFPGDSVRASLSSSGSDVQRSQRYGYVSNVCVSKTARRKGIGSSLLREAIKCAKSWKLKELFVHVNASNKVARHLYSKHKFQVIQAGVIEVGLNNIILLRRQL